jgi:hypothetical protein
MSAGSKMTVRAALLAPLVLISAVLGFVVFTDTGTATAGSCQDSTAGIRVDLATLPAGPVAGYRSEQLLNAALVINAGQALGLSTRAQTIGVMTAMGESSLLVLDHGDAVGPDSRGLFQQRANGAWGSLSDRMNPTISATNFFKALIKVEGWETLPPTIAAHRTQRNADPYHYVPYWDPAVKVVQALAGTKVTGIAAGTGNLACTDISPNQITAGGWTKPAVGPITSQYGMRFHPTLHVTKLHTGTDIGAPCNAAIYAAAGGTVVRAGPASGYGNLIAIDHGSGVVTRYGHMQAAGVLVHVGDIVAAGRQIARVGQAGEATGCHLHFEVLKNGDFTDPVPFMADKNAALG